MQEYRIKALYFFLHSSPAFPVLLKCKGLPFLVVSVIFLAFLTIPPSCHASLLLEGKLNINAAAESEILLLPHIEGVMARSIYSYRQKKGPFKTLRSLLSVDGMGRTTFNHILPYIKLTGKSDLQIRRDDDVNLSSFTHQSDQGDRVLLLGNGDFFPSLLEAVKKARESIHLSMFLFKTSRYDSNRATIFLHALASAAERGVRVSVLLEESNRTGDSVTEENRKSAEKLRKRGVFVRFDSPRRTTHTKAIVIDSRYVFIGSHNFTHSALRYNNELSLMVDSERLAQKTLSYMKGIN